MRSDSRLKVLFATSELAPFIKISSLGETSAALPAALAALGADVRVLVPGYPQIMDGLKRRGRAANLPGLPGVPPAHLLAAKHPTGVQVLIVECDIYSRPGTPYQDTSGQQWPDNALRFGLLSYIAALLSTEGSPFPWRPDVLHCNDWQTALAPLYLNYSDTSDVRTALTIHRLAQQGTFPLEQSKVLDLPPQAITPEGAELDGELNFLKAGLLFADRITTISPTYASEIQEGPLGLGLEGLLSRRSNVLSGILNGIDTDAWDPDNDPYIERYYNSGRLAHKLDNKRALRARLGLPDEPDVPLFSMVGRLIDRKGVDVVADIVPDLVQLPAQLIVHGSGDKKLEDRYLEIARSYPDAVSVKIGYEEGLIHQIAAGSDISIMPSRYEPCGENQMFSQRYGTPPVVHATGGLMDSVVDATPANLSARAATGFKVTPLAADTLFEACRRASELSRNKRSWRQVQKSGMASDFTWETTATRYMELYRGLIG